MLKEMQNKIESILGKSPFFGKPEINFRSVTTETAFGPSLNAVYDETSRRFYLSFYSDGEIIHRTAAFDFKDTEAYLETLIVSFFARKWAQTGYNYAELLPQIFTQKTDFRELRRLHDQKWVKERATFFKEINSSWIYGIANAIEDGAYERQTIDFDVEKGFVEVSGLGRFIVSSGSSDHIQVTFRKFAEKGPLYDDGKYFEEDVILYKGEHGVVPKFVLERAVNFCNVEPEPVPGFGK